MTQHQDMAAAAAGCRGKRQWDRVVCWSNHGNPSNQNRSKIVWYDCIYLNIWNQLYIGSILSCFESSERPLESGKVRLVTAKFALALRWILCPYFDSQGIYIQICIYTYRYPRFFSKHGHGMPCFPAGCLVPCWLDALGGFGQKGRGHFHPDVWCLRRDNLGCQGGHIAKRKRVKKTWHHFISLSYSRWN